MGKYKIERSTWFFLLEVQVTGETKQPWTKGSRASVQCFVPGTKLEDALTVMDGFLESQELARLDVTRAIRYDPGAEATDSPGNHFQRPLERAAAENECILGVFVTDDETSALRDNRGDSGPQ